MNRFCMNARRTLWYAAVILLAVTRPVASAQTGAPSSVRTISNVRGELYRAQDGAQTTLFLVTTDGILLVDPLNDEFARWLKAELETRFPSQPVKQVVYTEFDFERIGGGGVFKPSAEISAHIAFDLYLRNARRALPTPYAQYDRNMSGALEPSEIATIGQSQLVRQLDRNQDGDVTAQEFWSGVLDAERGFVSRRVITLGGKRVELVYLGRALGLSQIAIHFPDERVVFVSHHPALTTPFANRSVRPADVAAWTRTVVELDFDTLIAGNGDAVPRAQISALNDYVQELMENVAAGFEAGRSAQQLRRDSRLNNYSGTPFAGARDTDIVFLYQQIRVFVVDTYGVVSANYVGVDASACGITATCQIGPTTGIGGALGVGMSEKQMRAAFEMNGGSQVTVTRVEPDVAVRENSREVHLSFLGGYRTAPSGSFNIALLGGLTSITLKRAGIQTPRRSGVRVGPAYRDSRTRFGFTVGVDVTASMGRRFGLIIPARFTKSREDGLLRSGIDVRAGVGLRITAFRNVL